jgi:1-acyl-sn-glycerol-3-phosphate acyltransferase
VRRFKKGAAILARHLDVPIVPVAINGSFELWPRNRPFTWRLVWPWSGHRVRIRFGELFRVDARVTDAEAAADLRTRVAEMWNTGNTLVRRPK